MCIWQTSFMDCLGNHLWFRTLICLFWHVKLSASAILSFLLRYGEQSVCVMLVVMASTPPPLPTYHETDELSVLKDLEASPDTPWTNAHLPFQEWVFSSSATAPVNSLALTPSKHLHRVKHKSTMLRNRVKSADDSFLMEDFLSSQPSGLELTSNQTSALSTALNSSSEVLLACRRHVCNYALATQPQSTPAHCKWDVRELRFSLTCP